MTPPEAIALARECSFSLDSAPCTYADYLAPNKNQQPAADLKGKRHANSLIQFQPSDV